MRNEIILLPEIFKVMRREEKMRARYEEGEGCEGELSERERNTQKEE